MSVADYLSGLAILAALLAAVGGGSWLLMRSRFPDLRSAEFVVALSVLVTVGILAVHLLPGTLGILSRGSVLVAAAIWFAGCAAMPSTSRSASEAKVVEDRGERFSRPLALGGCALVSVFFLAYAGSQILEPSRSIDFMNFHLPHAIAWIKSGTVWQTTSFLPGIALGNYPNSGDVLILAAVLPWHNDFLAHLAIWPFFALTGVATYGLARRLAAPRNAALCAGALMLAIPVVAVAAIPHGITDSVMLFGLAAGLMFLARHQRSGQTSDLVLAGLALGLSFGTKWYGVSVVVVVVLVWAVARLIDRNGWVTVARQTGLISGMIALSGGVWLLRNWIISGNPIFPVKVELLGVTIFDAPPDPIREGAGFTIMDYVGDWSPWWKFDAPASIGGGQLDGILLQLWHALSSPALLVVAGAMVAALLVARSQRRERGMVLVALAAMALVVLAYAITPYTAAGPPGLPFLVGAGGRYVVPALVIAAALSAWVAGRLRFGTVVFGVLTLAAMVHGIYWASRGKLVTGVVVVAADWVRAAAAVAVIALVVWAVRPHLDRSSRARKVAVAAAVGALIAAGGFVQDRFNDDRYVGADPVLDAVTAAGPGQSVGITSVWSDNGISPVLPSFGPRFDNEVAYLGPIVREMPRRYERRADFEEGLRDGAFDLLVVGRGRIALPEPKESTWALHAGWQLVERSDRFDLYRPPE